MRTEGQTNRVRLTDSQRGVLMSSMSDASCGLTLGRSTAWVARARRDLAQPEPVQARAGVVVDPATLDPIEGPEAGSRKPEAGSRKPEAGSRKPEAGSRSIGDV